LLAEVKELLGAVLVSNNGFYGQTTSTLLDSSLQQLQSTAYTSQGHPSASTQPNGQTCGSSAAEALQGLDQHTCHHTADSSHAASCQAQQVLSPGRPKPLLQLELPHGEAVAAANPTTEPKVEELHCAAAVQQHSAPAIAAPSQLQEHQPVQQHTQQLQQQLPSPLMLSTKLFKPWLADVLMHVRAQVVQQQLNSAHLQEANCSPASRQLQLKSAYLLAANWYPGRQFKGAAFNKQDG
jgi:hypothetical protein